MALIVFFVSLIVAIVCIRGYLKVKKIEYIVLCLGYFGFQFFWALWLTFFDANTEVRELGMCVSESLRGGTLIYFLLRLKTIHDEIGIKG